MKNILRILRSAKDLRNYYIGISALTVLVSLSGLVMPILSGRAIDEIRLGSEANIQLLVWMAIAIFVIDVVNTVLNNVSGYLGDQMATRLNKQLSIAYYQHLMSLPQEFFDKELSGKIINRLNRSITQITNFMNMVSNNFLQFLLTTIFALIIIANYSLEVAGLLFALYPIYIWLTIRSSDTWQKYQAKKNDHADIATGRFAEAISQVKVVKSYVQEHRELSFFRKNLQKVVTITKPQSRFWHVRDVRRRLVLNAIFLFVFIFIFTQAANGQYTPGVAVTLILLGMQIRIPIFTISFLVENTQRAIADSKDYYEIMDQTATVADKQGAKSLNVQDGTVEFSGVTFAYEKDKSVLKNISAVFKKGTKTALVGESGEGKTTLTNLILRLYEPTKGTITIDGKNISDVTQSSLRKQIAVVFQEPALFSGTIAENISYANPKASQKDIERAAKAANAHTFITEFEDGYQTQIGEKGLKLSGGQKQRLAIARALLKDAKILILDEATSSLDSKSESLVQEALERLMKNRTTIIIAHRLSTISHVDQIITIKNGQVDETGSPHQLARSGGIYQKLLDLQKQATPAKDKQLKAYDISA